VDVRGLREHRLVDQHRPPVGQAVGLLHGGSLRRQRKASLRRCRMHSRRCKVRRNGQKGMEQQFLT